jgi:hypothetical protein
MFANRSRCWLAVLVPFATASLAPASASAASVFVRAPGANGAGLSRTKAGKCFVVTPEHVVRNPGVVQVIGFGARTATARVQYADKATDVAVLAVNDTASAICDDAGWPQATSLDSVLASATSGSLLLPGEDGNRKIMPVQLLGVERRRVVVEPQAPTDRFLQGFSGGVLVINNTPVGMLLNVAGERNGNVFRFDYISGLIAGFFDAGSRIQIDPVQMRTAISRIIAAGQDDFERIKGVRDGSSDISTYVPTVMLPGADHGTLFVEDKTANFIVWRYQRLEDLDEATTLYEAVSRSIRGALPREWQVDDFRNGSDFVSKFKASAGVAGPHIEAAMKSARSGYEVEVTATALDTDDLIDYDVERDWHQNGHPRAVDFVYTVKNVSSVTVSVKLDVKVLKKPRSSRSSDRATVYRNKRYDFTLKPGQRYQAKGRLDWYADEDYMPSLDESFDVTIVR